MAPVRTPPRPRQCKKRPLEQVDGAKPSPRTRKMQRAGRKAVIKLALAELEMKTRPSGRLQHKALKEIRQRYEKFGLTKNILEKARKSEQLAAVAATATAATAEAVQQQEQSSLMPTTTSSDPPPPVNQITFDSATVSSRLSDLSNNTQRSSSSQPKGGRPKGSTVASTVAKKEQFQKAVAEAATLWLAAQAEGEKGKKQHNFVNPMIKEVERKYGLDEGALLAAKHTIKSRVRRRNASGIAQKSWLESVEPTIVDYCIRSSRIGQPLDKEDVIVLANELIKGTLIEDECVQRKLRNKLPLLDTSGRLVGKKWYRGFMKRWQGLLRRGRAKFRDRKREEWVQYHCFENMYIGERGVYNTMVKAKVARKLDNAVWRDTDGNIVESEELALGLKTPYELVHPEYVLFADECGANTNVKDSGHVGGQLFVLPVEDKEYGKLGSTTDINFTVIVFQAATGDPVLCAIILKSEKPREAIPLAWTLGIDWSKIQVTGSSGDILRFAASSDISSFESIYDSNRAALRGGPKCSFRGKEIPSFIGCSPNASITSELLRDMLAHIDNLGVYERTPNGPTPFLLVDGHHSRLKLAFMDYIHDPRHKWFVCLGVPYGTHLWQVADSSEMNGSFKIELARAKGEYAKTMREGQGWSTTDVVPLVNRAFFPSYGNVPNAKKAIAERGWNPLNCALLKHPDVLKKSNALMTSETGIHQASPSQSASVQLSYSSGLAGSLLDDMLREAAKDAGRQEKARKRREDAGNQAKVHKILRDSTVCLTSGKINSLGVTDLDEDVHEGIKSHARRGMEKNAALAARQKERAVKQKADRAAAWAERATKPRGSLKTEHLSAISMSLKDPGDSPLKHSKAELLAQVQKREIRLGKKRKEENENLSNLDVIYLLEGLEVDGDSTERDLMIMDREALDAELLRRQQRQQEVDLALSTHEASDCIHPQPI